MSCLQLIITVAWHNINSHLEETSLVAQGPFMNCGHSPRDYALCCTRCNVALYCNEACQRADWPEHRKICTGADGTVHSEHQSVQEIRDALGAAAADAFRVIDTKNTYQLDPAWLQLEPIQGRLVPSPLQNNEALLSFLTVPGQPNYRIRLVVHHDPADVVSESGNREFRPDPARRTLTVVVPETIDFLRDIDGKMTRLELIHEASVFLKENVAQFTEQAQSTPSIDEIEWADVLRSVFLPRSATLPMETSHTIMGWKIGRVNQLWPTYSLRNRLYLLSQFVTRGLEPEPVRTFNGWIDENRSVIKGARAFNVVVPVKASLPGAEAQETQDEMKGFVVKKMLYSYSQTKPRGKKAEDKAMSAYIPPPLPAFDPAQALRDLGIEAKTFTVTEPWMKETDNYIGAYARGRTIYLRAMDTWVWRTMFHEIAHILMDHTHQSYDYAANRSVAELEAESVSLLCRMTLGIEGDEESLVYIREWFKDGTYPEKSARRVIATARKLLEAGGVKAPVQS